MLFEQMVYLNCLHSTTKKIWEQDSNLALIWGETLAMLYYVLKC